uniref:HTH CENPB-type domain-containing protein n=1 Tax=Eptatretus burgeri TaxID=7764 RepID=A0A8C4QK27_EPTBU
MAQKTPNKELTLDEKVKIIQSDKIKSQHNLAVEYSVSKSQVQCILKRKAKIMTAYEENAPIRKKRFKVQENQKIDEMTWSWFSRVRALNCAVSGPMIKEPAMEFARSLEVPKVDFTASNGWLSQFKARHNINSAKIPGESASVPQGAVDNWTKRVPTIIARYDPKDIFNLDESAMFYHTMPDRTLCVKGTECKGGKQSKEHLTAAFLVNIVGEFQKTLIIGKSKRIPGLGKKSVIFLHFCHSQSSDKDWCALALSYHIEKSAWTFWNTQMYSYLKCIIKSGAS